MQLMSKLGVVQKEYERSLLLVGNTLADFTALRSTICMLGNRDSRIRLVLSSPDVKLLETLRQQFPTARVIPLPFANRLSVGLYLRRLNIRVAAFAGFGNQPVNRTLLTSIRRRAVGIVALSARGRDFLPTGGSLGDASESLVVIGERVGHNSDGVRYLTESETVDLLAAMLARDLKALREGNALGRIFAQAPLKIARSSRWCDIIKWRIRRFRDDRELKEKLNFPKVILCLGNGPSSEDPILEKMNYDILFRVNHSWLKRQILANPDVVFTGGRPTMRTVHGSVFGLPTPDSEERLILARAYHPLAGRTEFFNVNDVATDLKLFDWGHLRPTNGANMLAVAAALKPDRLVVAGIDLFQHPEGSYPGDVSTPNAYSPGHSRETELSFILRLFSEFRGEIVVVGDILRIQWESYKADFEAGVTGSRGE